MKMIFFIALILVVIQQVAGHQYSFDNFLTNQWQLTFDVSENDLHAELIRVPAKTSERPKREIVEVNNVNDIMDTLMPTIHGRVRAMNLDPLALPDLHSHDLSNCQIFGMSSLFRAGDSYLIRDTSDRNVDRVSLYADIGFSAINGSCHMTKRCPSGVHLLLFILSYRGLVLWRATNVTAFLRISVDLNPDATPVLDSLIVDLPRDVELQVQGEGSLSFVVDTATRLYRRRMRYIVQVALENEMKVLLSNYLAGLTLRDLEKSMN